ncbi:hypothetical protein ACWEOZ_21930 [Actinoplanes sp. NPDC004185]
MKTIDTYDGTELPHRERSAGRLIVRSQCWPLQPDSEETQLSLVTGDGGTDEEAATLLPGGAGRGGARPHGRPRHVSAPAGSRPFPFAASGDPAGLPGPAFDEQRAASLACVDPGRSGHPDAYECIAAIVAERTLAA